MNINPVHQGTRDLIFIALYLVGQANTFPDRVSTVPAGAGIHRGHQHEPRRVVYLVPRPGQPYGSVFQGLPQYFQCSGREFGQFVQVEHPVMGQGYFSGQCRGAPARQGNHRGRVVWGAERAGAHQPLFAPGHPGHRPDAGGFHGLGMGQRRKDPGKAACHEGLPCPRRTGHEHIVAPGRCHLQGPSRLGLPAHQGKIRIWVRPQGCHPDRVSRLLGCHPDRFSRFQGVHLHRLVRPQGGHPHIAFRQVQHLGQVRDPVHVQAFHHGRLAGRFQGKDACPESAIPRMQRHGQRPPDGPQRSVQRQFPHAERGVQHGGADLFRGGQHRQGQWQVIGRAFLPDIGRSHVDYNSFTGDAQTHGMHSR